MKVYGNPFSTAARKVYAVLAEKQADYESIFVDLMKKEQKKPEYIEKHPFAVVPVLEDDGFWLYESRAIIRYLDARLPGVSLTPKDLKEHALMEQWISVEQSYFASSALKIIFQMMFVPFQGGTPNMDLVEAGRKELANPLNVLNKALSNKTYLAGDQFSLADLSFMPYLEYLYACNAADLVEERQNVRNWWNLISERPSWKKATGKE